MVSSTTLKETDRRLIGAYCEPELVQRLDEKAAEADRSRSAEIRIALRQHIEPETTGENAA